MTGPGVSVIIVSHGRPTHLVNCLTALRQQYYQNMETVVVSDQIGIDAIASLPTFPSIKSQVFEGANISAARNTGLQMASGELVAFIDDDAIAEPEWLAHLVSAFDVPGVAAAGGLVLGRNGISPQRPPSMVFPDGMTAPLSVEGDATVVFDGVEGRAIRTEGTNMAFRRQTLIDVGGFDEAMRFYMDDTDMNMRIAKRRMKAAIVRKARVHHRSGPSDRRAVNGVPRDLYEIGRSSVIFLNKHAETSSGRAIAGTIRAHRRRLVRHMVAGRIMPGDVRKLSRDFQRGVDEGRGAKPIEPEIGESAGAVRPTEPMLSVEPAVILSGRFYQRRRLFEQAAALVKSGKRCEVYLFSATTLYHRVWYEPMGFWVQSGGQFGKSDRSDPLFRFFTAKQRLRREIARRPHLDGSAPDLPVKSEN